MFRLLCRTQATYSESASVPEFVDTSNELIEDVRSDIAKLLPSDVTSPKPVPPPRQLETSDSELQARAHAYAHGTPAISGGEDELAATSRSFEPKSKGCFL